MQKNTLIYGIIGIVALFGLLFGAYKLTNQPTAPTFYENLTKTDPTDHIKWNPKAKNVLIEYSDLQCPGCRSYHAAIKEMENSPEGKQLKENVAFVYRHFPLDSIHPLAREAGYAAEAASLQGKFFEMHDIIFERQDQWTTSDNIEATFIEYAKELKLDTNRFEQDMKSQAVKDRVQQDAVSGNSVGVDRTPTFFLNGQRIEINDFNQFKQLLLNAGK